MPNFSASYKKYTLVFKKPAGTSRGFLHTRETFFLCLTDRNNPSRIGLGECGPLAGLSPDARPDFETHLAQICNLLNQGYSPADFDLTDFPALAFGLETALRDWQYGGTRQLFETDFSRGIASIPNHGLIWLDSRAGMLRQVHDNVARGCTCIKIKIGALDFHEECNLLADIRRAYPPGQIELRLDANGAFGPDIALEHLAELARYDIHAIEQPIKPGQWSEMAALCAASPIDIALDEELIRVKTATEKKLLLETIKPAYLVLKPALVGGLAAAEEWIALGQALKIGWWVNSALESNIGLNAICQWASSLHPTITQGLGTGQLYTNNIPGPIHVTERGLVYEQNSAWDISRIVTQKQ